MDKLNESIKCWSGIYNAQLIIIKIIGQRYYIWWSLLISTQQTHFFTNHDLQPKFDIQGVNKTRIL